MSAGKIIDDRLIDGFADSAGRLEIAAAPEILFHYTSAHVVSEIVKGQQLWNTHILDMRNDPTEFSHGLDLFKAGLTALEGKGLDRLLSESLKRFIDEEKVDPLAAPGVFCLSPVRDDPNQWKRYGERGAGICIGFHSRIFVETRNVIYEHDRQKAIVDLVNEQFLELVKALHQEGKDLNDREYVKALALAYFRVAYMQAVRFKHQDWTDEREWRGIVLGKRADLKTYMREGKPVRYFPVEIAFPSAISEVLLGPEFVSDVALMAVDRKLVSESSLQKEDWLRVSR